MNSYEFIWSWSSFSFGAWCQKSMWIHGFGASCPRSISIYPAALRAITAPGPGVGQQTTNKLENQQSNEPTAQQTNRPTNRHSNKAAKQRTTNTPNNKSRNPPQINQKMIQKLSTGGVPHRIRATVRWGTPGSRAKKTKTQKKRPTPLNSPAVFWSKKWPTWLQVESQVGAKIDKQNPSKNRSKNWCLLGSIFGFWSFLWRKMEPSW